MIAIDTNVLVRYLVRDDVRQAEAARELLDGLSADQPGFICREVVIETVWVLERAYRVAREQVALVLDNLVTTEGLVVEAAADVDQSAVRYRQGGADFADLMIAAAADRVDARPLYTFDRRLARLDGVILIRG